MVDCINWATNRKWQTELLDTRKVPQLDLLSQKFVNQFGVALPNHDMDIVVFLSCPLVKRHAGLLGSFL